MDFHQPQQLAMRLLLQAVEHDPNHADEHLDHGVEGHVDELPSNKNLRITAIFIVLAAGCLGGLPCLFLKAFYMPGHAIPRLLRAASAGVILSLALIHVFPEAVETLADFASHMSGKYTYNPAGACAVFGIILMLVIETSVQRFVHKYVTAKHTGSLSIAPTADSKQLADPHVHTCMGPGSILLTTAEPESIRNQVVAFMFELGCIFHSFIIGFALGVNQSHDHSDEPSGGDVAADAHGHEPANDGPTLNTLLLLPEQTGFLLSYFVTARLGVTALIIALSFHQWLEGIALGSFIMRAGASRLKGVVMILVYSLTCPLGIAIGISVSGSYNPDSVTATAMTGVFNALSAGMLLYIGLVQLIAEDFSRQEVVNEDTTQKVETPVQSLEDGKAVFKDNHSHASCSHHVESSGGPSPWLFAASHLSLFLGAAAMAVLALWA